MLAEDGAALLGLAIAAASVYASHALNLPMLDGVASMLIGVLLAAVAVVLMFESRGLLDGEGLRSDSLKEICRLILSNDNVCRVEPPLSVANCTYPKLKLQSSGFFEPH